MLRLMKESQCRHYLVRASCALVHIRDEKVFSQWRMEFWKVHDVAPISGFTNISD